ncbi:MlaD family protein [Actinocorallia populi]|uniref:MlaD family protein n=1 Tax=Actinocorallia populi TaxID=2079200 RepID=UPI0013006C7B|nr:MlaD family protein [Actinocorallia populi]
MHKKRLALTSLGVIGLTVLLAFAAGTLRIFERGYLMSGSFADSGGVKRGDDVRLAGVPVGRVTSVEPDYDQGEVVIAWKVDHGVRLGRRTRADIQLTTLLGGRYIKLSGPVASPYLHSLPETERHVPADRTSAPFTVTDAVSQSTRIAEKIDTKLVEKLLDQAVEIDYPDRKKIRRMLTDLGALTTTLNEHTPDFVRLMEDGEKLTGALAAKDQQLVQLLESSRLILRELVERRAELSAVLGEGSQTVGTLSRLIATRQQSITGLLDDLHLAGTTLGGGIEDLNTGLALLAPTFQGLTRAGRSGPWIDVGPVGAVVLNPGFIGGGP